MDSIEKIAASLNISSFRAVNNPVLCENFSTGHGNVLKDLGIKKLTSANKVWHKNPDSYVIAVQMNNENDFVAGARVDVCTGSIRLPIEEAIGFIDDSIYGIVNLYSQNKTGEVCGLWTSSKCAGNGIAFFMLKSSIAIARLLNLGSLFALCSPFTVSMFSKLGFEIEKSLGNEGQFYYPKLDLIATAMILKDINKLDNVSEETKADIKNLADHPILKIIETGSKGPIEIDYNLTIL